jgi:hypothetical protein
MTKEMIEKDAEESRSWGINTVKKRREKEEVA